MFRHCVALSLNTEEKQLECEETLGDAWGVESEHWSGEWFKLWAPRTRRESRCGPRTHSTWPIRSRQSLKCFERHRAAGASSNGCSLVRALKPTSVFPQTTWTSKKPTCITAGFPKKKQGSSVNSHSGASASVSCACLWSHPWAASPLSAFPSLVGFLVIT